MLGRDDFASTSMAVRSARYMDDPPPENWDGVEVLHEK
jgi:hypothetical protein